MADPEIDLNTPEVLGALTFEDISDFVAAKVKNHSCPCCSTNDWSVLGDNEHFIGMMAIKKDGTFTLPPPSIPVFAIECKTCGFVRTHTLAKAAAWKLVGKRNASAH